MRLRTGSLAAALGGVVILAAASADATMPPRSGAIPTEVSRAMHSGLLELSGRASPLLEPAAGAEAAQAATTPRTWRVPVILVSRAMHSGLLELSGRASPLLEPGPACGGCPGAEVAQAATTPRTWRVPVILVSYSDSALIYSAATFQQALFDTTQSTATGAVYDYYQWASGGRLRVVPTVVATVTVPNTREFYGGGQWGLNWFDTPRNDIGLIREALEICFRGVEWTPFDADQDGYVDMLWVVHAGIGGEGSFDRGDLWSITSALSSAYWRDRGWFDATVPGGPRIIIDRFSMLPEQSLFVDRGLSEIGVYCHEFGHALGLPDLYDTLDEFGYNVGPGVWSLMSNGAYGGDNNSPQYPSNPGGWCNVFLGWNQSFRPAQDTLVTLQPIQRGGKVMELWFQGESNPEHFLVERRLREGFDRKLPNDGVLLYHVDDFKIGQRIPGNIVNAFDPALVVVEADGRYDLLDGTDRGDASDCFPGALGRTMVDDGPQNPTTSTFLGAPTYIALRDITLVGADARFHAQVRAPGWAAAVDQGDASYDPVQGSGPATTAVADGAEDVASVSSELRAGHAQVILRSRVAGRWQPPLQLSHTPGHAVSPAITSLPGGDLAVVWSDNRGGRSRIYYRARIRGWWSDEQSITDLPGDCLSPEIGSDANGVVQVAWIHRPGGKPQVLLARFAYLSPFAQAIQVSRSTDSPGPPALAVSPDGISFVVWADEAAQPQSILFSRYVPGTGISAPYYLAPPYPKDDARIQQSPVAMVDGSGGLHTSWLVSGPGLSEIHYQRRDRTGQASPLDAPLEVNVGVMQNQRIAMDPQGGIHLVFQSLVNRVTQVRYKRWRIDRGWDESSTEITALSSGSAVRPMVVPFAPGRVSVLYTGYPGALPRFMERQRLSDQPLAPRAPLARPVPSSISVGPNPLHGGQSLRLSWAQRPLGPDAEVEFYDLQGRRVATWKLDGAAGTAEGGSGVVLDPSFTSTWPSGIYFARMRGARQPVARLVFLR